MAKSLTLYSVPPHAYGDTATLQDYLVKMGFDLGGGGIRDDGVDGIAGPATVQATFDALTAFQAREASGCANFCKQPPAIVNAAGQVVPEKQGPSTAIMFGVGIVAGAGAVAVWTRARKRT